MSGGHSREREGIPTVNKVLFYGRVGSDIDFKVNGEHQSARFSLAVDRKTKDKKTDFFRMVAFGKQADVINRFFHKGSRIAIEAIAVQPDRYTGQNGQTVYPNVEFWVNGIDFVDTKSESGKGQAQTSAPQSAPAQAPQSTPDDFMSIPEGIDNELPFS